MVSKKLFSAVLVTAMILSVLGGSSLAFAQTCTPTPTATTSMTTTTTETTSMTTTTTEAKTVTPLQNTIFQIAANNTNLTELVALLKTANLTDTLNKTGNTILAPTNDAFNNVNASTLADLQNNTTALRTTLLYHVIPTTYLANNFTGNGTVTTVNGLSLPYSVNGTKVIFGSGNNTATVTKADINASNGVIPIDGVLMPAAGAVATTAVASAVASAAASAAGGFLGLPGFEALYAVAGLLAVAYLVIRRRK
jgi:PGF-CTERM protein